MTVLEEYKLKVSAMTKELREGRTDQEFCNKVADKLDEMMHIVVDTGVANWVMADSLRIMIDSNKQERNEV